eukprot:6182575-Pleurochrysis_carterae.AAC.2
MFERVAAPLALGAGAVLVVSRFEDLTAQIEAVGCRGVRVERLLRQPRFSQKKTDHRCALNRTAALI